MSVLMSRALLLLSLLLSVSAARAQAAPQNPVEAELVAETQSLQAGTTQWVALRLRPEPQWHVYWRNPGDSGIPTRIDWSLPEGVQAGAIHWPAPHSFRLGDLVNYGYGEETLHLVPLTLAGDLRGTVTLKATAKWLVCKDICIPGSADLQLQLPVDAGAGAPSSWAKAFTQARAQLPQPGTDWPAHFAVAGDSVSLALAHPGLAPGTAVQFYAYAADLLDHAAAPRLAIDDAGLRLSQRRSSYFTAAPATVDGVLVIGDGKQRRAYEISAQPGEVPPVGAAPHEAAVVNGSMQAAAPGTPDRTTVAPLGLLAVLGLAFVGGLILNLMPCVFPVLSLKALAIARAGPAGERRQAFAYSAGVIVSCIAAALAILALRGAGEAVGWGFQLQSPVFVGALAYLLFALGLSLSGHAPFGARLMGVGQKLTESGGLTGAFFTGVLAVVVASPCTAPFMGTALGYALTQPPLHAVAVFAVLGAGLALPFLLLGLVPSLARLLPKPGAWMERFKQLMAFPLYLTVVWLLWVLARQLDVGAAAQLGVGLVLIAFMLWLGAAKGLLVSLLKLAALAGAIALLIGLSRNAAPAATAMVQPWSAQRVAELRAEGRTIFVDFTADWCLSCKLNERVALHAESVQAALRLRDAQVLVADWTRADPAITAELARFGRSGVPLYLVYVRGGEPKILPQLLTPDLIIDALD